MNNFEFNFENAQFIVHVFYDGSFDAKNCIFLVEDYRQDRQKPVCEEKLIPHIQGCAIVSLLSAPAGDKSEIIKGILAQ